MRMTERGGAGSAEELYRVLADLQALSGDIESCGVLSKDGNLLSSSHGEGVARENGKNHASQIRVKAEGGHVLLVRLEGGGTLVATTGLDARVGLVLYDMRHARGEVEKALEGGS